ncbi:MAG: RND transporter [Betaproteobacteria bacterium HGW-Betaproteobacteria-6]|jgi:Cu/Ag efflux protein CusF|nr:MAG: RND transporter [Betaproteobacteria bacterium HGW-Betaproteobacteria-6]
MKTAITVAAIALVAVAHTPAIADSGHHHGATMHRDAGQSMASMSEGTVKKLDKAGRKITIAHGPLANLKMPPMTMTFDIQDKVAIDRVKPGDKVRFVANDVAGALTVTQLENAK